MSTASERVETLVSPHCVLYASFRLDDLDHQQKALGDWLEAAGGWAWRGRAVAVATDSDSFPRSRPDTFMVLLQTRLDGACSLEDAARFCVESVEALPLPRELGYLMSETAVVLARVETPAAEREEQADALLASLTGGAPAAVAGGLLGPGVALWSAVDDVKWLALLCDDDEAAEVAAARRLYGALWQAETCAHKVRYQADPIGAVGVKLKEAVQTLSDRLARLTEVLEVPMRIDPDAASLIEAIKRHAATTRARGDLARETGDLRARANSIAANRDSLVAYRDMLGAPPGRAALDGRLREVDRALNQIRTELGECQPVEQIADDTATLHQNRLTTAIALTEMSENRQRQRDDDHREKQTFALTLLGLWIGVTQTLTTYIPFLFSESTSHPVLKQALLFVPPTALGLWSWVYWPRKKPQHPNPTAEVRR